MKIQTTDNTLNIKMGDKGGLMGGIFLTIIGAVVASFALTVNENTIVVAIVGLVFAAVGLYMLYSATNRSFTVVKGADTTYTQKRILFGSPASQSFPTNSIKEVNLEVETQSTGSNTNGSGSRGTSRVSTLSFILNDNSMVAIDTSSGNSNVGGISSITNLISKAPLSKESELIANFLGLQVTSAGGTGSPLEVISNIVSSAINGNKDPLGQLNEQPGQSTPSFAQPQNTAQTQPQAQSLPQPNSIGATQNPPAPEPTTDNIPPVNPPQ